MNVHVYGKREYSRLVADLAVLCGHEVVGFVDDSDAGDDDFVLGVGYNNLQARASLVSRLRLVTLVHPRAYVRNPELIEAGSVVMAGAVIDMGVRIGRGAVIWNGANLIHDVEIGENTFVSPGATICGRTRIGRDCFIGAGAVVVDHLDVPDGTFIKAGSLYK